jgi:uncharacterized repeat protein (TIGR03803 family)
MTTSSGRPSLIPFAILGLAAVSAASPTAAATIEKVLHVFRGGADGATPGGALIADETGNLYGGTAGGGSGTTGCYEGCGTLYMISKGGGESVLYSFQGGADGISPLGPLLRDDYGNLYGVTEAGAGTGCATGNGCGAVFKFTPHGAETVLYGFQGGSDGDFPEGGLIADNSGNLFGVTVEGGNYIGSECSEAGCGIVFEVQPNGAKTTLYAFQGGNDGANPFGGLIADASGNLYGSTFNGGGCSANSGDCGTVFKVAPGGSESVLYAFQGGNDGMFPEGNLVADGSGNLYGTTSYGGAFGAGTVFEVSPNGHETILYSFRGGSDGANPEAGLVMDKKGDLYGATIDGGSDGCQKSAYSGCGTIFEVTRNGKESVLLAFRASHGENPAASLLLGKHDGLYGTTMVGGKDKAGVAFVLKK